MTEQALEATIRRGVDDWYASASSYYASQPDRSEEVWRAGLTRYVRSRLVADGWPTTPEEQDAEIAWLRQCIEPGRASGIVAAMFQLAEERGHNPISAKHGLSFLVEELDKARAEVARLEADNQTWDASYTRLNDYAEQQRSTAQRLRAERTELQRRLDEVVRLCDEADYQKDGIDTVWTTAVRTSAAPSE